MTFGRLDLSSEGRTREFHCRTQGFRRIQKFRVDQKNFGADGRNYGADDKYFGAECKNVSAYSKHSRVMLEIFCNFMSILSSSILTGRTQKFRRWAHIRQLSAILAMGCTRAHLTPLCNIVTRMHARTSCIRSAISFQKTSSYPRFINAPVSLTENMVHCPTNAKFWIQCARYGNTSMSTALITVFRNQTLNRQEMRLGRYADKGYELTRTRERRGIRK